VGHELLGKTWTLADPLLVFVMLSRTGTSLNNGLLFGLRALGNSRRSFRTRMWASVSLIVLGASGAVIGGARGAAVAMAAVNLGAVVLWWQQFSTALREHRAHAITSNPVEQARASGAEVET
jgi:hypothetical protein